MNEMAQLEGPATLSEISRKTGLNISTTHRLLQTLISKNFVEQDPYTGRYRLGSKVIQIGQSALVSLDIRKASLPLMERLYQEKGYYSYLVLKNFQELIVIGRVPHAEERYLPPLGGRMTLHSSTPGRLLLRLEKSESEVSRWESYQQDTVTDEGWTELAVPIYDYSGHPLAALTVCLEKGGERLREDLREILKLGWEISQRAGAEGVPVS